MDDKLRELIELIGEVPAATFGYGIRDDHGRTMDTLKVIESPASGYLAAYHVGTGRGYEVHLATSEDLMTWRHRALLDAPASQPTIAATSDGGFLVVVEAGGDGRPAWLRFKYYPDLSRLLAADAARLFDAPHTLTPRRLAEGTPNIYQVTHSEISVGFHYWRRCRLLPIGDVDRQARGVLVDFKHWSTQREPQLDAAVEAWKVVGNIGGRDHFRWHGRQLTLIEGQFAKRRWESWRVYLYDPAAGAAYPVPINTHGGSVAFGNPKITLLTAPTGRPALLVTLYLHRAGAARGEEGPLLYYREIEPGSAGGSFS